MRIGLLSLLLLLPMPALARSAQEVAAQAALNELLPVPEAGRVSTAILKRMQDELSAAGECVPTSITLGPIRIASATRMAVDGLRLNQLRNMWTVTATSRGCPGFVPVNWIVALMGNDELFVRRYSTGDTVSWVSLITDSQSMIAAQAVAVLQAKGPMACKSDDPISIVKREMGEPTGDLGPDFYGVRYRGGWREIWTYRACNRDLVVPITFRADGNGGATWNAEIGTINSKK